MTLLRVFGFGGVLSVTLLVAYGQSTQASIHGRWFGALKTQDGDRHCWLSHRHADGTYPMGVTGRQRNRRACERVLSAHEPMTFRATRVLPNRTPLGDIRQTLRLACRTPLKGRHVELRYQPLGQ